MKNFNLVGLLVFSSLLFVNCEKDSNIVVDDSAEVQVDPIGLVARSIPQDRLDGEDSELFWTVFKDRGDATITFPFTDQFPGNFELSYQNTRNTVGGKGWEGGSDRAIGYNVGSLSGNFNFVGVYGWAEFTDVEYYVIEKGDGDVNDREYELVRSYAADGKTYNFYRRSVINAPCALSSNNCDFWQYKSVRQNQPNDITGTNGRISMAIHAEVWRNSRFGFGDYTQYQVFGIEGFSGNAQSSGGMNATVFR